MIPKSFDQDITENDLQILKENSILEGKTIEYKQSLPGNSDSERKEFLADVSSFANASGGDLIYGIIEDRDEGTPEEIEGISIENVDQEKGRMESIIRDGIEPRLLGIIIKHVDLSNTRKVLIIRIPKSWISPHRVSFRGHNKFYSRSNSGKYELDVSELRVAFNLSETITERIRKFRENRISKIYANETPVPFYENAKVVLQLIPIISFSRAIRYDIDKLDKLTVLRPMYCEGWNDRYNLDGFVAFSGKEGEPSHSYVQIYRNGIIEAVEGLMLKPTSSGKLFIPGNAFEGQIIKSFIDYISVFQILNVELPILVFLTLIGVKGYSMGFKRLYFLDDRIPVIDREILLFPEILIENYDIDGANILKPSFDAVWNACGHPGSLSYDKDGNWIRNSI
jgi:hypothetical protein